MSRKTRGAPDFICIGPEKTGTTLLYTLLQKHPQVSLPPIKELRYWDEGYNIPKHSLRVFFSSDHWHYTLLRKRLKFSFLREIKRLVAFRWREPTDFYWRLDYSLGRHNDDWYERILCAEPLLAGDISPLYYHLPEERIADIHRYHQKIKIIIFIRDPIERAWSKIKMNLLTHRKRGIDELDFEEFKRYSEAVHRKWVPYHETIALWSRLFSQVHVALYDDLQSNQANWYEDICQFLNIDRQTRDQDKAEYINISKKIDLPSPFQNILIQHYGEEIRALVDDYPHLNWLEKYDL